MRYKLRFDGRDVVLPHDGSVIIGRDPTCGIVLADRLASRLHARITVSEEGVLLEDLGSANHVFVNGSQVRLERQLAEGDRIVIGSVLLELASEPDAVSNSFHQERDTLLDATDSAPPTRHEDALEILGSVAKKLLAAGDPAEAERLISNQLEGVLGEARAKGHVSDTTAKTAAMLAIALAGGRGNTEWIDYVLELFTIVRRPLPLEAVDELHALLPRLPRIDLARLRKYLDVLDREALALGPQERFAVQRIAALAPAAQAR
jgi:pSer/pThr/pTyr-binding forkhead associated (FHA) protein